MTFLRRFKPFETPAYYIFQDPDTKHIYKALTKEALFHQIINYRLQNRLSPIEALDLVLESYWCGLPHELGKCRIVKLNRSWEKYKRGGIVLLRNLFLGEKALVPQAEADRRASICTKCPKNIFPDKGPFMEWADEQAEKFVRGKRTIAHGKIGNCEVCTCVLSVKVWMKGPHELTTEELNQLPDFCWQREDYKIVD